MSRKIFTGTVFLYEEDGREVRYNGIAEHLQFPPGFESEDLVQLFINNVYGFSIPETRIEPGMFTLGYLRRFGISDPDELWTVKKIKPGGDRFDATEEQQQK